ncbi:MAG: TolC family protein [Candidatus Krumholzibacteriia bacterium]
MNVLWPCRMRRASVLLLLIAAMTVAGTQQGEAREVMADTGQIAVAPPEPASGSLALGDALALALANNPRLSVFDLERRVRDALALQASLRPNPELEFEVENFAGTGDFSGFGGAEYTLSLAQVFELGGKRSGRTDVATLDSELASYDYETVRLEVLSAVMQAFVRVVAAQDKLQIADDLIDVATQDLEAVDRRIKAGATSPIELTRARVAVATAQMERESLAQALVAARARLAATWGSEAPAFEDAVGDLEPVASPPDRQILEGRLAANPGLARWQTELAQRRAALALERALGKIDLVAAGGFRRIEETGDNAFVAGLSIPLPTSNRNQGNVAAAELRVDQVERQRRSAFVAAQAELAASYADLTAAYGAVRSLRDTILPEAQEAMATAESAYLKGLFTYTDVLAVRSTFFELRVRYIESLVRYHTASAEIERLVAGPIAGSEMEQERP